MLLVGMRRSWHLMSRGTAALLMCHLVALLAHTIWRRAVPPASFAARRELFAAVFRVTTLWFGLLALLQRQKLDAMPLAPPPPDEGGQAHWAAASAASASHVGLLLMSSCAAILAFQALTWRVRFRCGAHERLPPFTAPRTPLVQVWRAAYLATHRAPAACPPLLHAA